MDQAELFCPLIVRDPKAEGAFGIFKKNEPRFDLLLILRCDERELPGFDHATTEVDAVQIGSVPLVPDGNVDEFTNPGR